MEETRILSPTTVKQFARRLTNGLGQAACLMVFSTSMPRYGTLIIPKDFVMICTQVTIYIQTPLATKQWHLSSICLFYAEADRESKVQNRRVQAESEHKCYLDAAHV